MSALKQLACAVGTVGGLGVATLGWSLIEARWPVLRRIEVPVLAPGSAPIKLLHIADLHLTGATKARVAWVRALADIEPDLVINTGDNLSTLGGVSALGEALEPLLAFPGAFVLGDHDRHGTVFRSPTRYLRRDPRSNDDPVTDLPVLPWEEVRDMQLAGGWKDLDNCRDMVEAAGQLIELVGVADAHADDDAFPEPVAAGESATGGTSAAVVKIGVTHAPYQRVLDQMVTDGAQLILAGHTHGGQLCLPGYGALVSNCDLPPGQASGLSTWPASFKAIHKGLAPAIEERQAYLHVSAGLGTSPFTPVRTACRPEATLLTLTAR